MQPTLLLPAGDRRADRAAGQPGALPQLAGRPKTDRLDAQWIARLAEMGLLRPSFVPPACVGSPFGSLQSGDPAVIGLHISGFADRSLNSRTCVATVSCAGSRSLQRGLHHVQQRHLQLSHNLPSCLAHAAVPLMINRQGARGCTCCTRSGQTGDKAGLVDRPSQNARHRRGRRAKYPSFWTVGEPR